MWWKVFCIDNGAHSLKQDFENSIQPYYIMHFFYKFFQSAFSSAANGTPPPSSESETSTSREVVNAIADEGQEISPKKVFVFGATGSTGRRIVKNLLKRGIKVKAGVRDFEKAREIFGPITENLDFVCHPCNGSIYVAVTLIF